MPAAYDTATTVRETAITRGWRMLEAERGLYDLLVERLLADDAVDDAMAGLVLAAWSGEHDLAEALAGRPTGAADPHSAPAGPQRPEAYLAAVHVEGFRGIADAATLPLRPGPGLTLVTGRNGSGKSSFAEAAELALTGDSARWSNRGSVWRDGWRNLHASGGTSVSVDLVTAGTSGTTRIERRWSAGDDLDDARWTIQEAKSRRADYDGGAWRADMGTYRPFLSYGELGALIDGKPSELHDAVFALLGLGPLTTAHDRIRAARKSRDAAVRSVNSTRRELRAALDACDDERAGRAAVLLKKTAPDLDAVAEMAAGSDLDTEATARLRALLDVALPDVADVHAAANRLRSAEEEYERISTPEACAADETARLLRAAVEHHDGTGDEPCPVCGSGSLDAGWHRSATDRIAELEATVASLREARRRMTDSRDALQRLAVPLPAAAVGAPVGTDELVAAWDAWSRADGADARLAAHESAAVALESARKAAEADLAHRDEVWAPLARRLGAWHDAALEVRREQPTLDRLAGADDWLTRTAGELRDQRLAPFAESSRHVWSTLRQQSNVDLGPVRLDGRATRRRVALDVSVDGADGGAALGIMSQGELHALGLSLFLPRATVEESPFRFVMIDDPVQAMDPAKVDGLATLLSEIARDRQVVVFSHDDRLADSVRRLQVPAVIWEVQRRERSAVRLHPSGDPVRRYLEDAFALSRAEGVPADVRGELVATCCRSAIEAACHLRIRRTRLSRGETHAAVEEAITAAHTTHQLATLALFDDMGKGSDLLRRITSSQGREVTDAFQACKSGAHTGLAGDLKPFLRDVEKLALWLQG